MDVNIKAVPENLPDPNVELADWLAALSSRDDYLNLRHYRIKGEKAKKRLWVVEASRRFSASVRAKVLKVEQIAEDDERVNCYMMNDEARLFWQNGREQGMAPQQILDGWMAIQSLEDDTKSGQ